jgi:hypothetical protein
VTACILNSLLVSCWTAFRDPQLARAAGFARNPTQAGTTVQPPTFDCAPAIHGFGLLHWLEVLAGSRLGLVSLSGWILGRACIKQYGPIRTSETSFAKSPSVSTEQELNWKCTNRRNSLSTHQPQDPRGSMPCKLGVTAPSPVFSLQGGCYSHD